MVQFQLRPPGGEGRRVSVRWDARLPGRRLLDHWTRMALLRQALLVLVLVLVPCLAQQQQQRRPHPASPCPRVFSYEGSEAEADRWYGAVLLSTEEPLIGVRLDVQLDRPAKILGNWEGDVSTRDNIRYTILNLQTRLRPGPPRSVRIFVRYGEADAVPRVTSIALNGRRICPEDGNDQGKPAPAGSRPPYVSGALDEDSKPPGGRPLSSEGRPTANQPAATATRRPPDRTTRPSVLPVGGVGSGDRRPDVRPTHDPFSGAGADRTTKRAQVDTYPVRRTTPPPAPPTTRRPTSTVSFHNVWDEEREATTTPTTRGRPRPPDAEWITAGAPSTPSYKPTTDSGARRTTRHPSYDDGSVRCGTVDTQATPLVTNGQRTTRGQWPWHTALYQSKGIDLSYKCGGSLISRSTVLTAAHCVTSRPTDRPVEADTLVVFIGKYHLKLWSEGGVQDKQVSSLYVHPMYNSSTFSADIALLILTSPVEFTTFVRPVCLWGPANTNIQSLENTEGYVVGWGIDENGRVSEELTMAKMPVVSQETCIWSHPKFFSYFTSNRTYCAGFRNGTSVCNGDSGGGMVFPMTTRDGARIWQLRGIVSISVSKEDRVCSTSHYVVFTDVAKFLDWVRKYIK